MSECASLPVFSPAHQDPVRSQRHDGQLPSFAREILRYLREHPEAQDTVEGIMVWWVSEQRDQTLAAPCPEVASRVSGPRLSRKAHSSRGRIFYRLNSSRVPPIGSRK